MDINTRAAVKSLGFRTVSSFDAARDGRRFEILVRECRDALPAVVRRLAREQGGGVVVQDGRLLGVREAEFDDGADGVQRMIDRVVAAEHHAVDLPESGQSVGRMNRADGEEEAFGILGERKDRVIAGSGSGQIALVRDGKRCGATDL